MGAVNTTREANTVADGHPFSLTSRFFLRPGVEVNLLRGFIRPALRVIALKFCSEIEPHSPLEAYGAIL
jgi:hypothetical protein